MFRQLTDLSAGSGARSKLTVMLSQLATQERKINVVCDIIFLSALFLLARVPEFAFSPLNISTQEKKNF